MVSSVIGQPWFTVHNSCPSGSDYIDKFEEERIQVSDVARFIMYSSDFKASSKWKALEIGRATTEELTGKDGATTSEVFEGIRRGGGELLPASAACAVRLAYADQPEEGVMVAMQPIADGLGAPSIFELVPAGFRGGLRTGYGYTYQQWNGSHLWIFLRPNQTKEKEMLQTEEKSLDSYDFPVYGTQGGGLVRQQGNDFIFVELHESLKYTGLKLGDKMPPEWDMIPANELARAEVAKESGDLLDDDDFWIDY